MSKKNCNKKWKEQLQNKEGKTGKNALHIAVERGSLESVTTLLASGAKVNIQDKEGNSPLHYYFITKQNCLRFPTPILRALLDSSADVNVQNIKGETPLHLFIDCCDYYSQNRWENDLRSLLSRGVDSSLQDEKGETCLIRAVRKKLHCVGVECILRRNRFTNLTDKEGNTALHHAALSLSEETLGSLIRARADPNLQNKDGKTALHIAAEDGSLKSVKTLLAAGANVNIQDGEGNTPLHCVFLPKQDFWYYISSLRALLDKGADVNVQNSRGETPVHLFIDRCEHVPQQDLLERELLLLLSHGVDTNLQDEKGETCLIRAVRKNPLGINCILSHGAFLDLTDNKGQSALHVAAELGLFESVTTLLAAGANVNIQDGEGNTPLHCTFISEHRLFFYYLRILESLLEKGADVNVQNVRGETPVHLFIDICDPYSQDEWERGFSRLLSSGFDTNLQDEMGGTCLIRAVQKKLHPVAVECILSHNAFVNLTDNKGNSALHHAAMLIEDKRRTLTSHILHSNMQQEMMKTLIKSGADIKLQNKDGKTVASLYVKHLYRTTNIVELFKITEAGVKYYMTNITDTSSYEHSKYWSKLVELEHNKFWLKFFARSSEELNRMRAMKIGIIFSRYKDPVFVTDTEWEELVFSEDVMDQFPIYGILLHVTYERAKRRNCLLDVLSCSFNISPKALLPPELNRLILSHLSDKDLSNIFKAIGFLKKPLHLSG